MKKDVKELLTAMAVVLCDLMVFFLPLMAFFTAYVIAFKPKWVKEYIDQLYKEEKKP
jgi:hypothetical protein